MSCPANSHYEVCADACSAACPGLTVIVQCPKTCTEGCACDLGYLFNGQQCVQHQQCGCYEDEHNYMAGDVVYLNQCQRRCNCDPGLGLTCDSHTCANGTQCLLRDGVMGCYHQDPCEDILCREKETCHTVQDKAVCVPLYNVTCWAWGDPHYHTFDGYDYDFQGTCKYILSETCVNLSGLVPFSITQRNENRGSLTVSYVREVEVNVYGNTLTMVRYQIGQIMVNGLVVVYLPFDLHDGRVTVRHSGNAAVLVTDFDLRLHYDWDSRVDLQLSSSYYGAVCGLCGNFNNNPEDELKDRSGNPLPSIYQWAKSWRDQDFGVMSACDSTAVCMICALMMGIEDSSVRLWRPTSACVVRRASLLQTGEGNSIAVGEVSVLHTCTMRCECHAGGVLECVKQACAREEICDVQNGTQGCYSESGRCVFDAGHQLQSFDGVKGPVMSTGSFQMTFLCDQESPDWFRVVLDVRGCAISDPVNVTIVHIFLHDMIITVNNRLHSWVNGKKVSYPIMPLEGVTVSYRNETVVIERSDVSVTYSLTEGVVLTLSRELTGEVCGACGNFNGDAVDDMITSDGRISSMMSVVVSSWPAEDFFHCDV